MSKLYTSVPFIFYFSCIFEIFALASHRLPSMGEDIFNEISKHSVPFHMINDQQTSPFMMLLQYKLKHEPHQKMDVRTFSIKDNSNFLDFDISLSGLLLMKMLMVDLLEKSRHSKHSDGNNFILQKKIDSPHEALSKSFYNKNESNLLGNVLPSETFLSGSSRHRRKRDSSMITPSCGVIGRNRCSALSVGQCVSMCVNGVSDTTVCRLNSSGIVCAVING